MNRILIDSSVWIDHLHRPNSSLASLLEDDAVTTHPFVIGEIACGNLKRRQEFLSLLSALPLLPPVEPHELLHFIDHHRLAGIGLGFVDIHLLATCQLHRCRLWTKDKKLVNASAKLHITIAF